MSNHDPTAGGPICLRPIGSAELRVEGLSGHFWRKFISTVFSVTFPAMKAVGDYLSTVLEDWQLVSNWRNSAETM